MWEERCYKEGIPDSVEPLLAGTGRVPSYKEISMAILRNDHTLKSLGFSGKESKYANMLKNIKKDKESMQMNLL